MVREAIRVDDRFIRQSLDPLELFRVDSICFFFYVCPLGLLTGSGFMSPQFFLCNFSLFFLIIFMNNWQQIRVGCQLSWTLFFFMSFCSWLIKKINK